MVLLQVVLVPCRGCHRRVHMLLLLLGAGVASVEGTRGVRVGGKTARCCCGVPRAGCLVGGCVAAHPCYRGRHSCVGLRECSERRVGCWVEGSAGGRRRPDAGLLERGGGGWVGLRRCCRFASSMLLVAVHRLPPPLRRVLVGRRSSGVSRRQVGWQRRSSAGGLGLWR